MCSIFKVSKWSYLDHKVNYTYEIFFFLPKFLTEGKTLVRVVMSYRESLVNNSIITFL